MYTHIHARTHTFIYPHTRTHARTHTYIHACMHTHIYTHVHTCTQGHTHTYTCTHTHRDSYIHMHTCTYTHAHTLTHIYMHTYIHIYAHVCTYIHTYIHITHTHTHIHSFKCRLHISRYLGTQIQIPVTPLLQVGPLRGAGGKAGLQLPARILPTAGLWVERPPSGDQCGFGFVLFFYCFPNSLYCVHLGRFVV